MPKNKVQFQKGFSLHTFQKKYGTEEQCQERLYRARWDALIFLLVKKTMAVRPNL